MQYRNPWSHHSEPEFFSTTVKPVEYRGFKIFNRLGGISWELVKDGVCLTQRAGRNGPRNLVDALYGDADADCPFNVERARNIAKQFGVVIP